MVRVESIKDISNITDKEFYKATENSKFKQMQVSFEQYNPRTKNTIALRVNAGNAYLYLCIRFKNKISINNWVPVPKEYKINIEEFKELHNGSKYNIVRQDIAEQESSIYNSLYNPTENDVLASEIKNQSIKEGNSFTNEELNNLTLYGEDMFSNVTFYKGKFRVKFLFYPKFYSSIQERITE